MTQLVRIEVKTTRRHKWPIGRKITASSNTELSNANFGEVVWVFVWLPDPLDRPPNDDAQRGEHSPRFFVLSNNELYEVWKEEAGKYFKNYRDRHGRDFEGVGLPTVTLRGIERYEGQWQEIVSRLGSVSPDDVRPAERP